MTNLSKYSWITSAFVLIGGFMFLHFKVVDYGLSFFMLFPLAVGFTIGTHEKNQGVYSLIFGLLIFFGFLLAGALEGLVCVLMALPLFGLMVLLGNKIQKKYVKKEPNQSQKLMLTITPILLLLLINPIEQMLLPKPKVVTITNSILLDLSLIHI